MNIKNITIEGLSVAVAAGENALTTELIRDYDIVVTDSLIGDMLTV
jgi:hypothetical protein